MCVLVKEFNINIEHIPVLVCGSRWTGSVNYFQRKTKTHTHTLRNHRRKALHIQYTDPTKCGFFSVCLFCRWTRSVHSRRLLQPAKCIIVDFRSCTKSRFHCMSTYEPHTYVTFNSHVNITTTETRARENHQTKIVWAICLSTVLRHHSHRPESLMY